MNEQERGYRLAFMAAYAKRLMAGKQAEFNALALVPIEKDGHFTPMRDDRSIANK